jgi:probable phosphoglycerate mutase
VRHGETDWNREGRFQGQQDTDLTEYGLAQADKAAKFLSGHIFDAVVSSPLKRARATGEKIAAASGCGTFETMNALTEINHGDWEGLLANEVHARWPRIIDLWHTSPHTVIMPGEGGESLRGVQLRSVKAVEEIAARYSGDVALTSHDAVNKVLLCHFLNAPLSSFWSFQIANCSLTVAELRDEAPPRVSLVGDAHYLGLGFDLPEQKGL